MRDEGRSSTRQGLGAPVLVVVGVLMGFGVIFALGSWRGMDLALKVAPWFVLICFTISYALSIRQLRRQVEDLRPQLAARKKEGAIREGVTPAAG